MTPEGHPFYAATYLPKRSRESMIGLVDLALQVQKIWKNERARIYEIVKRLQELKSEDTDLVTSSSDIEEDVLDVLTRAFDSLVQTFDEKSGGFGTAPKFPVPHNLMFLLRYWKRTHDDFALHMVEKTLQRMRMGGIFDHIGGGFHRYSIDADWMIPHFEKMLYDQALLIMVYTEAYQVTGDQVYASVVDEIVEYVKSEMISPEGAFFAAVDAESEGQEGRFYTWTSEEIHGTLPLEDARVFCAVFNLADISNDTDTISENKDRRQVLYRTYSIGTMAKSLNIDQQRLQTIIDDSISRLRQVRTLRVHPDIDTKILADWNGLMIAALAKAGSVLHKMEYVRLAEDAMQFIMQKMYIENRLYHSYNANRLGVSGFLEDYAFIIWGLIELYQATLRVEYLNTALQLNGELQKEFWNDGAGVFRHSGRSAETLVYEYIDAYDGALPSGNSVSAINCLRLGRIVGDPALEERTRRVIRYFLKDLDTIPTAYTMMLIAIDYMLGPSYELVIVGDREQEDVEQLLRRIRKRYTPTTTVLLLDERHDLAQTDRLRLLAPYTAYYTRMGVDTTFYVCKDHSCFPPTTAISETFRQLDLDN